MRWLPLVLVLVFTVPFQAQEFAVASGLGMSPAPLVAAGLDDVLVVWYDAAGERVVGRRFGLDGVPRDPAPLTIVAAKTTGLSVAFDGLRYLVLWSEVRDTHARVAAAFVSSEVPEPIVLMDSERQENLTARVAVAWNGIEYVAVWSGPARENEAFVHAATIGADGRAGETVDIAGPFRFVDGVAVAAGGDRDLIVYSARTATFEAILDAQLIDRGLMPLDRTRLVALQGSNWGCLGSIAIHAPAALWAGTEWAVSWTGSSCRFGEDIGAARLSRDGSLLGMRSITPAQKANTRSELVVAGGEPVVLTQVVPDVFGGPVDLHRLWRNEPPVRLTGNIGFFSAASAGNRIVLVHENPYLAGSNGWRVDGRLIDVELPAARRRRAVR